MCNFDLANSRHFLEYVHTLSSISTHPCRKGMVFLSFFLFFFRSSVTVYACWAPPQHLRHPWKFTLGSFIRCFKSVHGLGRFVHLPRGSSRVVFDLGWLNNRSVRLASLRPRSWVAYLSAVPWSIACHFVRTLRSAPPPLVVHGAHSCSSWVMVSGRSPPPAKKYKCYS